MPEPPDPPRTTESPATAGAPGAAGASRSAAQPSSTTTALTVVNAAHARRLREIDPLLPATAVPDHGAGTTVLAALVENSAAMGVASRRVEDPGTVAALWAPARSHRLVVRLAGERRADAFDDVLRQWHDVRRRTAEPGDRDSAAIVVWPSHDVVGAAALVGHGFAPLVSIAARVRPTRPSTTRATGAGTERTPGAVTVRPAGDADVETMVELAAELHAHDANVGSAIVRPGREAALGALVRDGMASDPCWTWVAEAAGRVVGFAQVQPPAAAAWAGALVAEAPVAYLGTAYVRPGERGSGVGAALAAAAHRAVDDAGVAVTLLHHATANPTAAPFWVRQGYRPLWTEWRRVPAV